MSARIRALRGQQPSPLTPEQIAYLSTGQMSNLSPEDTGGSIDDYLNGPSMASVLLKQAKGEYFQDLIQQARKAGTEGMTAPMIASILQLDRQ
jgi:hypothetical protein